MIQISQIDVLSQLDTNSFKTDRDVISDIASSNAVSIEEVPEDAVLHFLCRLSANPSLVEVSWDDEGRRLLKLRSLKD